MKKSRLRKKSKQKISTLQNKIWELCKRLIRERWGNVCYTCGKGGLVGPDWHTGHLWPKASLGATMKYELEILRPQCYNCNINLGGNGARYYAKMLAEVGVERMAELEKMRDDSRAVTTKAYDYYVLLHERLTQKLKEGVEQDMGTLIRL